MLQAVHIARYRGVRELAASGFGRVNLIVGMNDSGKTAFMEALQLTDEAENAAHFLLFDQRDRLGRTTQSQDFERFWRPMFFGLDATAGFAISVERNDGAWKTVDVRQGTASKAALPRTTMMTCALATTTQAPTSKPSRRPRGRSIFGVSVTIECKRTSR